MSNDIEQCYQTFVNHYPYLRTLKNLEPDPGFSAVCYRDGKKLINFSSNDYLGLSKHPYVIEKSREYLLRYGVGVASSRLVAGQYTIYDELEHTLAKVLKKPTALILGSGYLTNHAVLEALLDASVLKSKPIIFCDRLVHASMLSGSRWQGRLVRFRHNDLNHLEQNLKKFECEQVPKFILVESLYSMSGEKVDLLQLTALSKQYHAYLYVDDAHAIGVLGEAGEGLASRYSNDIDIIMGTFSKGLGSQGGYIGCSKEVKNYLINRCKGLIYSTGISPAIMGAMTAAIDLLPSLHAEREKIKQHSKRLRSFLKEVVEGNNAEEHIIPWKVGDANQAMMISKRLEEEGYLSVAIRPPTVPKGESLIRFCISSLHTEEDIHGLIETIKKIIMEMNNAL